MSYRAEQAGAAYLSQLECFGAAKMQKDIIAKEADSSMVYLKRI